MEFLLVDLLAEEVGRVEGAHALDDNFVREHSCWSFVCAFDAFFGEVVSYDWLMKSWVEVALRRNINQEILPGELIRGTRCFRLSIRVPKLLTFVICFSNMCS